MLIVKQNKIALSVVLSLLMLLVLPNVVLAAGEYLEVLEHIAEDMEEIHHDMHKVVFFLRLMAYSSGIVALSLVGLVVVVAIKK